LLTRVDRVAAFPQTAFARVHSAGGVIDVNTLHSENSLASSAHSPSGASA
jgi:hypothetical protein